MCKGNRTPDQNIDPSAQEDLNLVRSISAGSIDAWHEFLDRYSGLIYGIARRHLFAEDEDDVRTVYVDILKSLYDGNITKYHGKASLSTWLIVYTRRRSVDFFRKRYGRCRDRKGYNKLSELDRKVLRLYHVERLPIEIVVQTLRWSGYKVKAGDIVESIQHIDRVIDQQYFKRLYTAHQSKTHGLKSARMLEYLIQLNLEYEERNIHNSPDYYIIEKEIHETADKIRTLISRLSPEEKKIMFLKFNNGWSAKKISEKLKLGGQRRVYTLINKAIRRLRKSLLAEEDR